MDMNIKIKNTLPLKKMEEIPLNFTDTTKLKWEKNYHYLKIYKITIPQTKSQHSKLENRTININSK